MVDRYEPGTRTVEVPARAEAEVDEGLRSYMLRVYNYMASGVMLTGVVALLTVSSEPLLNLIYGTPLRWLVMFAPLIFVFAMSGGARRFSATTLQAMYWAFAATMGLSLSYILIVYTGASVARIFFITSAMFGALSLYGYTTKKDLSGMGTFLFMGVIGILIAMVANMFMQSSALYYGISIIGVLIFAGLTAYDTQRIKEMYYHAQGSEMEAKTAVMGALKLYLDFINMFLFMLRLFGNRS